MLHVFLLMLIMDLAGVYYALRGYVDALNAIASMHQDNFGRGGPRDPSTIPEAHRVE